MAKTPNIYEIARKAKVSHMTVSRAFNKPELVKKKTRKKIFEIVNRLNYTPSIIARSMRTNKTNTIGLILPTIINPFFPEIVRGVDDYSRKNNYNVILVNTDDDYKNEISSLDMFINRRIDGIILSVITGGEKDEKFITRIMKKKIPVVLIDRFIPDLNCSYVITDNFNASYKATNYLIRLGHKNISVISPPQKIKIFQDRLKGYKKALKDNGIEFNENYIAEGEESVDGGYDTIKNILSKNINITAIFALCDFMAFGFYKYCQEKNIKIPDDVSIIGIDDIFTSALISPSLTTMAQQKHKIGYNAAKILIDSIKKNRFPKKRIILEANLIERNSCKQV